VATDLTTHLRWVAAKSKAGWSLLHGLRVAGWELWVRGFPWTHNPQLATFSVSLL